MIFPFTFGSVFALKIAKKTSQNAKQEEIRAQNSKNSALKKIAKLVCKLFFSGLQHNVNRVYIHRYSLHIWLTLPSLGGAGEPTEKSGANATKTDGKIQKNFA